MNLLKHVVSSWLIVPLQLQPFSRLFLICSKWRLWISTLLLCPAYQGFTLLQLGCWTIEDGISRGPTVLPTLQEPACSLGNGNVCWSCRPLGFGTWAPTIPSIHCSCPKGSWMPHPAFPVKIELELQNKIVWLIRKLMCNNRSKNQTKPFFKTVKYI